MAWKVFDYECTDENCDGVEPKYMINEGKEEPPKCPKCGKDMKVHVGTAFVKHISWSQWAV